MSNRNRVRRLLHQSLANRFAFDSAAGEVENPITELLALLRPIVDAQTLRKIIAILQGENSVAGARDDVEGIANADALRAAHLAGALQEGSRFANKDLGQDSAEYLKRFPNASRARVDRYGEQPPRKPLPPMTPAEAEDYKARFPDANRLKL